MHVAVIGGGIYGASIAYFLERFGEQRDLDPRFDLSPYRPDRYDADWLG